MKNWKTSFFGALAAVCGGLAAVFPDYNEILLAVGAVFTALLGYFAKDNNVTGGTLKQ